MDRRHVILICGSLSALLLIYGISFGPVIYVWGKAAEYDLVPIWLDDGLSVVFHPHLWCMYHNESYFDYIFWFVEQATATTGLTWEDFRSLQDDRAAE